MTEKHEKAGWVEHFMGFARHAATKSKDSTQVGAALVTPFGAVVLTGYNGPPMGVEDSTDRRQRPMKYLFASHAEANVVGFAARHGIKTDGCALYVTHACCSACMRSLIQAGITRIVYGTGKTSMPEDEFDAARIMADEAGVTYIKWTEE